MYGRIFWFNLYVHVLIFNQIAQPCFTNNCWRPHLYVQLLLAIMIFDFSELEND